MSTSIDTSTESPRDRLARLRAEVTEIEQATTSTTDEVFSVRVPSPGDQVHFLSAGKTLPATLPGEWIGPPSHITERGQTVTITTRLIEAAKDRNGGPGWLGFVYDQAAQLDQYGEIWVRPGPAPADLRPWVQGSPDWSEAREQARREAHGMPTEQQRADALAEVNRIYGPPPTTSVTLNSAKTPSERAYDAQEERIRAAVSKGVPNIGQDG